MKRLTEWYARRHGGVAKCYEKFTAAMERAGVAAIRARLAGDLDGEILEVGCGTGLNFLHYAPTARVTAIEPLEEFRTFAAERALTAAARIAVQEGDAQALPFPDHSFDAALCTLVFCSVDDAARGLRDLRRVLRPGARARFFEHVRSHSRFASLAQDLANPLWRRLTDGCNLNRDTVTAIADAGFRIDSVVVHDVRVPRAPRLPMREVHARA